MAWCRKPWASLIVALQQRRPVLASAIAATIARCWARAYFGGEY
jgi:hypothetical protein